jgi:hypothetical protein
MKVKENLCYNINYTLSGRLLLVGIKSLNSFVKIDYKYANAVTKFIDKYKSEEILVDTLDEDNTRIFNNFSKLGYLENDVEPKGSFNEFKKVGKVFFSFFPKSEAKDTFGSTKLGIGFVFLSVILMGLFFWNYRMFLPQSIDYVNMKLWEIIFTIAVFPWAVLVIHEIGHCTIARYVGVKIDNVSLGWYFIYPIILVQYFGLNLEKQSKKLLVMAGGIYFNFIMAFIGILLKALLPEYFHGAVIDIWISANISTIITNLGLFGMTDGYFMMTMLVGILDLRLKGFKYLNNLFNGNKVKLNSRYQICGLILLGLFVSSLVSIFININYWLGLFELSSFILYIAFAIIIIYLTGKFIHKIKRSF